MSDAKSFHMSPEEFRATATRSSTGSPITNPVSRASRFCRALKPGRFGRSSRPPLRSRARLSSKILADIDRVILPGITHWQSPNFFAYFPANASGPGILGDLLSSGFGVQGMLWSTSPACTELETHVLDWLVPMLGLPEKFLSTGAGGGVIQDTASSASLCALLAARERATQFASNRKGCDGRLVAYCSTQTHSSVEKAMKIAGMGSDNLRQIPVDENFAMRADAFEQQVAADIKAGLLPCFVCATVGTTSSCAIDPVREIAGICREIQALAARGCGHERDGRALPRVSIYPRRR
jgi:aromatic-L-amino-acid/L-tryptophan decarboxylase